MCSFLVTSDPIPRAGPVRELGLGSPVLGACLGWHVGLKSSEMCTVTWEGLFPPQFPQSCPWAGLAPGCFRSAAGGTEHLLGPDWDHRVRTAPVREEGNVSEVPQNYH